MFHIITPCSRPDNLPLIKDNILKVRGEKEVSWHICYDTSKVVDCDRKISKREVQDSWIYFYTASTDSESTTAGKTQVNFVLTHFRINKFSGFIYVLDDDNLLPPDFFNYNYDENESKIYLFSQMRSTDGKTYLPMIVVHQIDQAQLLSHSSIMDYYNLNYHADGEYIQEICSKYSYKVLPNPVVYYNRLTWEPTPEKKTRKKLIFV